MSDSLLSSDPVGDMGVGEVRIPARLYDKQGRLVAGPWQATDVSLVLGALVQVLEVQHREGRVDGALRLDRVMVDPQGVLYVSSDMSDVVSTQAAFECHAFDPAWTVGPWTDVYGLSCIGYTLITGQASRDVWDAIKDPQPVQWPADVRATYPQPMLDAIAQGLAFDPNDRPSDLEKFSEVMGLPAMLALATRRTEPVQAAIPAPVMSTPQPELALAASAPAPAELVMSSAPSNAPQPQPLPQPQPQPQPEVGPRREPSRLPFIGMTTAVVVLLGVVVWMWLDQSNPWRTDVETTSQAQAGAPSATASNTVGQSTAQLQSQAAPETQFPLQSPVQSQPPLKPESQPEPELATTPSMVDPQPPLVSVLPSQPEFEPTLPLAPPDISGLSSSTPSSVASGVTAPDPAADSAQGPGDIAVTLESNLTPTPTPPPTPTPTPSSALVAVSVAVKPWGEVFVDGASRGISPPLTSLRLAPGNYRITIRNPNMPPHTTNLNVARGKGGRISHSFE